MKYRQISESDVLTEMCQETAAQVPYGYTDALSSVDIAYVLNTSRYQVRKHIKSLIEQGLVKSKCESCYAEYKDHFVIVKGYALTELGKQTDEYKRSEIENDLV